MCLSSTWGTDWRPWSRSPWPRYTPGVGIWIEIPLKVESQCEESGLVISGFYHAHDNLRDNHVDIFSQKIADKVGKEVAHWCTDTETH